MKTILLISLIFFSMLFAPTSANAVYYFSDGALIKGVDSPEVYFIENGMKRWIEKAEHFNELGLPWNKIKIASENELKMHPTGKSITNGRYYPEGMLIREEGGYKVYLIKRNLRYWIEDPASFSNLRLNWDNILDIPKERLSKVREQSSIVQTEPIYSPNTVFLKTPENDIIEDTTVEFEFSAITGGFVAASEVLFETFLEGYDTAWRQTTRGNRSIRLPAENGEYIFFARAKYKNGGVDPTPEIFEFNVPLSPIFGDISFSSVNVRSDEADKEYITLNNRTNLIYYISGWTIESKEDKTRYKIPDAHLVPNYPGYSYEADVKMAPKDKVTIYSSKSPLGYGFKLNSCIGYLNDYFDFTPALPRYCKKLDADEVDHLTDYCQSIIRSSTSSCTQPNYNDIRLDNDCRNFMREKLNYASCVNDNISYYDFYKGEWRLYFGKTDQIWKEDHDTLILRDKNGLVVDTHKY